MEATKRTTHLIKHFRNFHRTGTHISVHCQYGIFEVVEEFD